MARPRRVAAALVASVSLALAVPAPARALRPLHVESLSMRADRTQLRVGEVFHLAIRARVKERVAALDELVVPDVGTMQLLGDERHVTASASGTEVVETLTLEPTQSGTFTFNGAYLDAIDAGTGKPSRFSANPVRVSVESPGLFYASPAGAVGQLAKQLALIALAGLAMLALIAGAFVVLARGRRAPTVDAVVAAPPAAARTARDEVADALRAYRTAPSTGSLLRLRSALFAAAGAGGGATLRDALAATPDSVLREALVAAERTAFGPERDRDASSAELIDIAERWLR